MHAIESTLQRGQAKETGWLMATVLSIWAQAPIMKPRSVAKVLPIFFKMKSIRTMPMK